jgi:hypothetical protein
MPAFFFCLPVCCWFSIFFFFFCVCGVWERDRRVTRAPFAHESGAFYINKTLGEGLSGCLGAFIWGLRVRRHGGAPRGACLFFFFLFLFLAVSVILNL